MITYKVDGWNNFCRVFEFPEGLSSEFCHGGGIPTTFKMVDWFNPIPGLQQSAVSKEVWKKEVGEIETEDVTLESVSEKLLPFLQEKQYVKEGFKYIVICDFGLSFIFTKDN